MTAIIKGRPAPRLKNENHSHERLRRHHHRDWAVRPGLARRLVAAGQKVAVIERKFFGGTCVNTGCIPTKTLVASAYAAYLVRRASDYGVTIGGPVDIDMKAVKARKDAITEASRRGVERSLKTLEGCTVYEGHAQFVADKRVAVGDVVLNADHIFINVGARALVPPIPGLDQVPYLTNSSMMDVDFLPSHLIVLGGSYIGLEFARSIAVSEATATVVELAPRLIAREDEDVSRAVAEFLKEEGIDVRVDSKVVGVEKQGKQHRRQGRIRRERFRRSLELTCWWRSDGSQTRTTSAWTRPVSPPIRAAIFRWMINCAPTCPGYGRWVTATVGARLHTRHTMTSRS